MANYARNAIQGVGSGAAAGAAFGPWGALAGGAIGLAAGLFSAYEDAKDNVFLNKLHNSLILQQKNYVIE